MTTFIYNEGHGEVICEYCAEGFSVALHEEDFLAIYGGVLSDHHEFTECHPSNLPNALCVICEMREVR